MKKAILVGMMFLSAALVAGAAVAAVEAEAVPTVEPVTVRGVPMCTVQNGQIVSIEITSDAQRVAVVLDERGLQLARVKGIVEASGTLVNGQLVVESFKVIQLPNHPTSAPNMPMRNVR